MLSLPRRGKRCRRLPLCPPVHRTFYAVGALGYFLLTGRPIFAGRTVVELCSKHLYEAPVPPSRIEPSVPRDLEALLLSCLAKSPQHRPQDAAALRAALLACSDADRWSDGEAQAWWTSHGSRLDLEPAGNAPTIPLSAAGLEEVGAPRGGQAGARR